MRIDLNCDCGESFGHWQIGDDPALLPHVTSANIACGGHAGDPSVMTTTVRLARQHGVVVGAHPGYPDLTGFGRRVLPMSGAEITATVLAQIGALYAVARSEQVELTHVKPHGALYTHAAATADVAEAIVRAIAAFSRDLILVGLAGSVLVEAGQAVGLTVAREAFADRAYEANGLLRARGLPGAVIEDDQQALMQALKIVMAGNVVTPEGVEVPIAADTLCVHGDTPNAARRAAFLRSGLQAAGVDVIPLDRIVHGA